MNWQFWKPKLVTCSPRVEVLQRDPCKLRLHEWQTNNALVKGATVALSGDFMRLGMDVLRNEHPGSMVLPLGADQSMRAAHQARCEGYTLALANLEALTQFKEQHPAIEPTFETEEKPE